jgi:Thioredoxin
MDLWLRVLIVVVLLAMIAVLTLVYQRRSAADEATGAVDEETGAHLWPLLPEELGASRTATWVIFSTPLCVSCGAVQAQLERSFPHHRVLKIDATERPDLADLYHVRRAPTTIVADANGTIVERFVGPQAVADFIIATEDPALLF